MDGHFKSQQGYYFGLFLSAPETCNISDRVCSIRLGSSVWVQWEDDMEPEPQLTHMDIKVRNKSLFCFKPLRFQGEGLFSFFSHSMA